MKKPKYLQTIEESGATFLYHENSKIYYVEYEGVEYAWSNSSLQRKSYPWVDNLSKFPKGFHIYKMYCGETLIYIGKTKNLSMRLHAHFVKAREEWHDTVTQIEVSRFENEADMHLLEAYMILKHKPFCNKDLMCGSQPSFELPEPGFTTLTGWEDY